VFTARYANWHRGQVETFAVDVTENWQSEYLQFFLYIMLTVWLLHRGSPESKSLDKPGRESDQDQRVGLYAQPDSPKWARAGGWRRSLLSNSLGLVMGLIFGWWFQRTRRVLPLMIAHSLIDIISFIGYVYLHGHVDWI